MKPDKERVVLLKRFLELFSVIIEKTEKTSVIGSDDSDVTESAAIYPSLSYEEKKAVFNIVRGFGDQGYDFRLYFEFMCLHFYKDAMYAEDILDCLLYYDMDLTRRFNYYSILTREMFLAQVSADYCKSMELENMLAGQIIKESGRSWKYIPYDERNSKSVVIIIRPFLGEYHSPTLQIINLDNYLRKLGYKTFYVSYSDNALLREYAQDVPTPFKRSVFIEGNRRFEYKCFDRVIEGIHYDLSAASFADDIGCLAEQISQIAPEFVIGVEGSNILADICTVFTDVISMNVVDDLPVTLSDCVLRYFPGEYKNEYLNADNYGKIVYEAKYDNELMPYNDGEDDELDLRPGRFYVCIMGNRLDEELDDEMLGIIRKLLDEVDEADILFIGKCPKTEDKLNDIKDRCRFAGYVKKCEDAVAACSLFLNPPRRGGGGGGYMAIKRSVPVYTLRDCDVASCVGEESTYESYNELIPFVKRCVSDNAFFKEMCNRSGDSYTKRYRINSLENVRKFTEKYTEHIRGDK